MTFIAQKIQSLGNRVEEILRHSGRKSGDVRIIYVTKTVEPGRIREAVNAGAEDLGENRVQELLEKKKNLEDLPGPIRWHMIGHLQTNKVKQVIGEVSLIHSLDSLELAETLEKQAAARKINNVPCLIQVNSTGENSKFGLAPQAVEDFVAQLKGPAVRIQGLMTIGPLTENRDKIRAAFRSVRELRDQLQKKFSNHGWEILSMGMSGDFEIAIEEGSTLIRVGTAVFGERKTHSA